LELLRDNKTNELLFGGGAGGGKTFLGCIWQSILSLAYPGIKSFIARDELKKIMQTTFITFNKVMTAMEVPQSEWRLDGKYNYIEFKNKSRIDLLDVGYMPSDPLYERFGSSEYTVGWIEEGGDVHFGAYDILKTRVGRHLNDRYGLMRKILVTGNPSKNWQYLLFYKLFREGKLPENRAFIQSLVDDNLFGESGYKDALLSLTDTVQKERLLRGNWEYDNDKSALMPYDAIMDIFHNVVDDGPKYMTGDIARFGKDKTTIGVWSGFVCSPIITKEKQGLNITAEDIRQISTDHRVPYSRIAIDEGGVGGGVIDMLGGGVRGFIANASPFKQEEKQAGKKVYIPQNYANLKAQCAYLFAEKVNNREVAVLTDDIALREKIIQELEQIKRKDPDKDGKLDLVPKDMIKENIGRSPDYSDMLIMRMLFEVDTNKKYKRSGPMRNTVVGGIDWEVIT
jgi:hypothetical protein